MYNYFTNKKIDEKNKYLYETHAHTSEVSPCGRATAVNTVDFYKQQGFSGVIFTDHLKCHEGVTATRSEWNKMIDDFMIGYNLAYEHGRKIGIQVFFAWEFTVFPYNGLDILTYGLDPDRLYEHNEICGMEINDYCDYIKENGGFSIHAHPFRDSVYIKMIRLIPNKVDGVEVYNANRTDFENERANDFADAYNLLKTGGTDNHKGTDQINVGAMAFDSKLVDIHDFIQRVKDKSGEIVRYSVL